MQKTFKYRIYPTKEQERALDYWLYLCRRLYNAMLEQRQIAYRMGYKLSVYDQKRELPVLRRELPEYAGIEYHVLYDVCFRLGRSYKRFFNGAGFPKFQGRHHYNSFTFSSNRGWKLENGTLTLRGCGLVKVKWSREVQGDIKTVTIIRRAGQWFVCFNCDNVPAPLVDSTDAHVGIDMGIEALATTSGGERFANAKYLRGKRKQLRRMQRHLARQKRGSNRRKKTIGQLQRLHLKIANQRADAHHKATTVLVRRYATIVHEDISPQFMIHNRHLAGAAHDVGWGQFLTFLQSKAAAAGRTVIAVNPAYTSQTCSGCGAIRRKKLSERWHSCDCGTSLHRDHNAAINIMRVAGL